MCRIPASTLASLLIVLLVAPALADEPEPRTFDLLRDSAQLEMERELEEQAAAHWDPQIQAGELELSFSLGFLDLNTTVLSHDQIIYKYTDSATSWGDLSVKGGQAFSPALRMNYNFTTWLGVEGMANFSIAEYESDVQNRRRRPNTEGAPVEFDEPPLGEYDLEKRSLSAFIGAANLVWYPLNMDGDGMGRWHPYLTAGVGRIIYNMNSNYTDDTASSMDFNYGAGIRMIFDKSVSLRLDVAYHINEVQFTPSENFQELDEGTKLIPLEEFPQVDQTIMQQQVTSYEPIDISSLQRALGFQVTF